MTKEEAIDIIKSECYVFNPLNFDRSTMVNTALDMAVKSLKQEPFSFIDKDGEAHNFKKVTRIIRKGEESE